MDNAAAHKLFSTLIDGQEILVKMLSAREFKGIYDADLTDPDIALHFDTLDGQPLRAEWPNIASVNSRGGGRSAIAGRPLMVPSEHPLGQSRKGPRPYTVTPGTNKIRNS